MRGGRGQSTNSARPTGNRRHFDRARNGRDSSLPSVPSWNAVVPGSSVSIVLKADQPTGREVQGTVQDVLTRHDHPRGVKVRLTDGRVGRVQRMVSSQMQTQADLDNDHSPGSGSGTDHITNQAQPANNTPSTQRIKYRDIRLDDQPDEPPATTDLSAYIKPAKQQKKRRGQNSVQEIEDDNHTTEATLAICPVCNDFQGDESAVAHHVQTHFD